MANGHGGIRKGQGRKSKAEELNVVKLGTDAIVKVYGSLEKYWEFIAKESKESYPHLKMLNDYTLGKPKETKDIHIKDTPTITVTYANSRNTNDSSTKD